MKHVRRHGLKALVCSLLVLLAGCEYFISADSRYERAQVFVAKGDYRSALIQLRNALDKKPDMPAARLLLADVALWLGDAPSADRELHKVQPQQDPVRYADLETRIDLALGRQQAVLDRLAAGGDSIPVARQSYYRGAALLGLKQAAAAEQQLHAAVDADPKLVEAKAMLGEAIAAQNDTARAVLVSAEAVRQHPDSALARLTHGMLLARRGDTTAAREMLERAHELAPTQLEFVRNVGLLVALTDVHLAQLNLEQARASSDELSKLASGSTIAEITSSRVLMAANDYVGATASLRSVTNANPKLPYARFLLAVALLAQGNLEQAGQELSEVIELMPEHAEARQLLAQVRMRQNDPDGAMRVLVPALQSGTDESRVASLMDAVRTRVGDSGQAVDLLERALQSAPDNRPLQLQLASAYLQTGQAEKALTLLRKSQGSGNAGQREALLLQAIADARGAAAARAEVDAMVAAHPSDASLLGLAAAFYAHIGDAPSARRLLADALQKEPRNASLLFTLSQIELSSQRPAEARSALRRLLEVEPQHVSARLTLAQLDYAAGDVKAAEEALETLSSNEPRAPLPRLLLARMALMRDDSARADALIAEAIKSTPGRAELHNAAGVLYLNHGRFDQALAQFRKGAEIDSSDATLWLNLGRAQQALGQEGAARESLAQALKIKPDWLPAEGALTFIDVQAGRRAAALERVARLRKKYPREARVLVLAGDVHAVLRDYADAAHEFEAAAQIQPTGQLAIKLYEARRAGQQPKQLEPLERWVEKNPDDLVVRSVLADAYTLSGERQRAIEQYERIVGAQPKHVPSLNNLAWLYFELKDRRALEVARKAHELAPAVASVGDTLGWILVELGQIDEGLPILQRAASVSGANPEIRYHYAVALSRAGSGEAARAELGRILEEHANFPSRASAQQLQQQLKAGGA